MARIKLIIDNEERDILRFSTDYFDPNPLDPCWVGESTLKSYKKEGVVPEDYKQPILRSLKDFRKYKVPRPLRPPVVSFYDPCPFRGLLNLTMESTDNDDFFLHAFRKEKWFNGRIEIYNVFNEDIPFRLIEFWDACIIEISEHFAANSGSMPMLLRIEISPATVRVNKTVVFQKSWYETDINAPTLIYQSAEEEKEDKKITKMYWVDADTEERIEEIAPNTKMRLYFETEGYRKGETVKAKVKRSDDELFDDNSMSLTFSGIVDEYGKAISDEVYENNEN